MIYHFTRSSNKSPGRSWLSLRTGFLKRTWRPRRKQRKEPKTLRWVRYVDTKWRRCVSSGIFFQIISQTGKNVSHPRIWGKIWVAISGVLIKVKLGKMIDFVFYNWIFVILLRFFNPSIDRVPVSLSEWLLGSFVLIPRRAPWPLQAWCRKSRSHLNWLRTDQITM